MSRNEFSATSTTANVNRSSTAAAWMFPEKSSDAGCGAATVEAMLQGGQQRSHAIVKRR